MNKRVQPAETAGSVSLIEIIVVEAMLQFLTLLITMSGIDGGVLCGIYVQVIAGYWATIGFVRVVRVARGRSLLRIVAITGWIAPVGCLMWVFVPMIASAAHLH